MISYKSLFELDDLFLLTVFPSSDHYTRYKDYF